jgi:DNA-nicking Smr family endonuclease
MASASGRGAHVTVVKLPIDGVLDLHTFSPRDIKTLVPDWLAECRAHGLREVRIVHGKGTGALRASVHAILDGHDDVIEYGPAGPNWGATVVLLRAK